MFARPCRPDNQDVFQQQGRIVPYGTGRLILSWLVDYVRGTATAWRKPLIPPLERPPLRALCNGEYDPREPSRMHIGLQGHFSLQTYAIIPSCFSQPCSITRKRRWMNHIAQVGFDITFRSSYTPRHCHTTWQDSAPCCSNRHPKWRFASLQLYRSKHKNAKEGYRTKVCTSHGSGEGLDHNLRCSPVFWS
jgi:hypothetical protein